ncbi:TIGR03560 family F420-dependent LLM class oxidoreductase [Halomontanus rarus]|uniref:TIGR03560 family F420-dependent LLM class oxidoreductase n=1 Tax=Halomontanus rarus TaxID=3034020 RepID=UPI00307C5223
MDINVMIEGQDEVNWDRWQRIVRTVEDSGFDGLFRSDHFTNEDGPYTDSLELWVSFTWLAENTDRIQFGSLVTPLSFRDPIFTARMAKDVDNLSDGRLTLGVGTGWQEREHEAFGYDLLDLPDRFERFEEGLEVIASLLRTDEPVSFDGEYEQLNEAKLLPRPNRPTPILVGGNGRNRTMPLAAEYGDEWNGVWTTVDQFADLCDHMDDLLRAEGRDPDEFTKSVMTRVVFGRDETEVERLVEDETDADGVDDLRQGPVIVGTEAEVAEHLDRLEEAGADQIMLQWLELDEMDRLEAMADAIL